MASSSSRGGERRGEREVDEDVRKIESQAGLNLGVF